MIGSKSAYARHRGCDPGLISRWVKSGRCPVLSDGRVDFEAADAALASTLDPSRGGRNGWSGRAPPLGPTPSPSPDLTGELVIAEPIPTRFDTPINRFALRWQARLTKAQRRVIAAEFPRIRQAAGDDTALAAAMGVLFTRLQQIFTEDSERLKGELGDTLGEEIEAIEAIGGPL